MEGEGGRLPRVAKHPDGDREIERKRLALGVPGPALGVSTLVAKRPINFSLPRCLPPLSLPARRPLTHHAGDPRDAGFSCDQIGCEAKPPDLQRSLGMVVGGQGIGECHGRVMAIPPFDWNRMDWNGLDLIG